MSEERYTQIIDEVYEKYADSHEYFVDGWMHVVPMVHSKETFVDECKTDPEFSEKWGLKIEERELGLDERMQLWQNQQDGRGYFIMELLDNIPTKLITLTYNNETIEVYEPIR